jgi:hypothetical protein
MTGLIKSITSHLYNSDGIDVPDYDDVIGDIRVCVSFDAYMDTVNVKASEILDKDWDLLYEDTAVLTSRLKPVLAEYNRDGKEAREQARNIDDDRYTYA